MLFGVLFTFPSSTPLLAGVGAYSSPLFDELLPFAYIIMGFGLPVIIVGVLLAMFWRR